MDYEWAREKLSDFVKVCDHWLLTYYLAQESDDGDHEDDNEEVDERDSSGEEGEEDEAESFYAYQEDHRAAGDEFRKSLPLIFEIKRRLVGNPTPIRVIGVNSVRRSRGEAITAIGSIDLQTEVERLGPVPKQRGPMLSAGDLHPWVWDAAKSFWESRHYAEAVLQGWKSINAHLQDKVGRRDVTDDTLVNETLSPGPSAAGKRKLRLQTGQNESTSASRQRGMHALGQAAVAGIRNVVAHEDIEFDEVEALEFLALLSALARWIDAATVMPDSIPQQAGGGSANAASI